MTVGDLRRRMSAEEFTQWAAFYRLEPWGEARADLRSGVVASLLFNIHKGKDTEPLSPADFLLFQDKEARTAETPARDGTDLQRRFRAMFPAREAPPAMAKPKPARKRAPKKTKKG